MLRRLPTCLLLCLLALCLFMAGCGGSATATVQDATPSPIAPGPVANVALTAAKTCHSTPTAGTVGSPAVVDGNLYFVHTVAKARQLSGVRVIAPKQLPAGMVIQGFEIPLAGSYASPTPAGVGGYATIDLAQTCDLRSPLLIRLEESTKGKIAPIDQGTAKTITLGERRVTWSSSERYDAYEWQSNGIWFSLTIVSKGTVPLPRAEAIIADMPAS